MLKKTYYNPKLKALSRRLRREGTLSEVLIWMQIKGRQVKVYKFTRQKPIGNYIVDFYCSRLRLAIEIDSISHENKFKGDKIRQREIEKQGIKFLGFYVSDIKNNMEGVMAFIRDWIEREESRDNVLITFNRF
ncbi:DUF559 domain-containing protein [candidate division KSB1 bacterium]|nr:DUF559 domain-containing protein [candidate division KSB1 bacterium]